MTRRERLTATLQGRPVDRPAVSFYEVGGWPMDRDHDAYTVWNDPSWRPLVDLAHRHTDIMRLVEPRWNGPDALEDITTTWVSEENAVRITRTTIRAARGIQLTRVVRRDRDVQTDWVVEHPLKTRADLLAYLDLPEAEPGRPDITTLLEEEQRLGEAGIACLDTGDPLCAAAPLFDMETYTVVALEEPVLFHRLLDRFLRHLLPRMQTYAAVCGASTARSTRPSPTCLRACTPSTSIATRARSCAPSRPAGDGPGSTPTDGCARSCRRSRPWRPTRWIPWSRRRRGTWSWKR